MERKYDWNIAKNYVLKKLNIILIIVCLMQMHTKVMAQSVLSSAGMANKNENGSISWTLGEIAIETFETQNHYLTQGFQQPNLSVVGLEELLLLSYVIQAFPNPTNDYVHLVVDKENIEKLNYLLYDTSGKLIINEKLTGEQTRINFQALSPGVYYIQVLDGPIRLKTFKILKTK
jgi:hypothetical protein